MTDNKLIVNGVDHSKFILKWAKRGGVLRQDGEIYAYEQNPCNSPSVRRIKLVAKHTLRMATPDGCDATGVEYESFNLLKET